MAYFFILLSLNLLSSELMGIGIVLGAYRWIYAAWGLLSLVVMSYLVKRLIRHYRSRARISSPGPRGPIWISPFALKDFVLKTLEEHMGLTEAKVQLEMDKDGVAIRIRTSIPLSQTITELGHEIQEHIKTQVEKHIGVQVERVEVFASSISADQTSVVEEVQEQETGEYTPLEFPERERNE